jgi:very-short-patch-repair endonuclease
MHEGCGSVFVASWLAPASEKVLRFLAEDVGKDLDSVLDAILRALGRRR